MATWLWMNANVAACLLFANTHQLYKVLICHCLWLVLLTPNGQKRVNTCLRRLWPKPKKYCFFLKFHYKIAPVPFYESSKTTLKSPVCIFFKGLWHLSVYSGLKFVQVGKQISWWVLKIASGCIAARSDLTQLCFFFLCCLLESLNTGILQILQIGAFQFWTKICLKIMLVYTIQSHIMPGEAVMCYSLCYVTQSSFHTMRYTDFKLKKQTHYLYQLAPCVDVLKSVSGNKKWLWCTLTLNLHLSMQHKWCAAGVFHQLITCYHHWLGCHQKCNKQRRQGKRNVLRGQKREWFYEGFGLVLYFVLWVLFSNSGGDVWRLCANSSPGIVWNVRSLALVPDKANTALDRVSVFSKQIWWCICVSISLGEWIRACVSRLNEMSHPSRRLPDKPRPDTLNCPNHPQKTETGYNQPAIPHSSRLSTIKMCLQL